MTKPVDDLREKYGHLIMKMWMPTDGDVNGKQALVEAVELKHLPALIQTYTDEQVEQARGAVKEVLKYVDVDYIECNGWKCRLPWCGSCHGEDEARKASADAKAKLEQVSEQETTDQLPPANPTRTFRKGS